MNQVKKLQNQYLHSNTGDDILLQAIPGGTGTRPKAGGAHDNFLKDEVAQVLFLFFVTVGFVYSRSPVQG